jgi:hypothetical protein
MHRPAQLVPSGVHSAYGARRPRECPAYRLPQVRELPLRLEPVAPDTFGGLVGERAASPFRAVLSTTYVRGAHT